MTRKTSKESGDFIKWMIALGSSYKACKELDPVGLKRALKVNSAVSDDHFRFLVAAAASRVNELALTTSFHIAAAKPSDVLSPINVAEALKNKEFAKIASDFEACAKLLVGAGLKLDAGPTAVAYPEIKPFLAQAQSGLAAAVKPKR